MILQIEYKLFYGQGQQRELQTRIKLLGIPIIIIVHGRSKNE